AAPAGDFSSRKTGIYVGNRSRLHAAPFGYRGRPVALADAGAARGSGEEESARRDALDGVLQALPGAGAVSARGGFGAVRLRERVRQLQQQGDPLRGGPGELRCQLEGPDRLQAAL